MSGTICYLSLRSVSRSLASLENCTPTDFGQVPKGNIFVGYSYLSADIPNTSTRQNLNGWEASLEGKVLPFLGIVADGSGHYGTTQFFVCPAVVGGSCRGAVNGNFYNALFGPRVSASFHGIRPFAHVLVGAGSDQRRQL